MITSKDTKTECKFRIFKYFKLIYRVIILLETCGSGCSTLPNQTETSIVGSALPCVEIKLVDWDEGGYRVTDPNPRGEIYIGGENITMGYYEMPEKTKEDYMYINGVRYFATGK